MQVAMQPRFEAVLPFAHPALASEATLLSLCSPLRSVAPGVLMLVCKQWQRAYLACPALHSKLVLILTAVDSSAETIDSWLVSTGQHLQRVGRLCSSLSICSTWQGTPTACLAQLPSVLSGVQPAHLTSLSFSLADSLPDWVPGWLGGMSRLAALGLRSSGMPQEVAAAIGALTQLQRLWVSTFTTAAPPGLLDSLLCLRQLVALGLMAPKLPPRVPLAQLDRLEMLRISCQPAARRRAQPLVVPPPAAFPALKLFHMLSHPALMEASGLCSWVLHACTVMANTHAASYMIHGGCGKPAESLTDVQ